ncbi:hypothetical protein BC830DRAFT_723025 [Chytriomyces sp. MP71]|nr:hypothetical protein BC830DRAFT_723025 [Chytriomyces sp. MP71]
MILVVIRFSVKLLEQKADAGMPAMPLLTVYCNLPYNYEDAINLSQELNDREIFSHGGFVYHPIDCKTKVPELGKVIGSEYTWFRPCNEAVAIGYAHTASNGRALLAELYEPKLRIGDKLATWHGQKITKSQILPQDQMPLCKCRVTGRQFRPHVIMARSSVDNRTTPGQLWESWLAMSAV